MKQKIPLYNYSVVQVREKIKNMRQGAKQFHSTGSFRGINSLNPTPKWLTILIPYVAAISNGGSYTEQSTNSDDLSTMKQDSDALASIELSGKAKSMVLSEGESDLTSDDEETIAHLENGEGMARGPSSQWEKHWENDLVKIMLSNTRLIHGCVRGTSAEIHKTNSHLYKHVLKKMRRLHIDFDRNIEQMRMKMKKLKQITRKCFLSGAGWNSSREPEPDWYKALLPYMSYTSEHQPSNQSKKPSNQSEQPSTQSEQLSDQSERPSNQSELPSNQLEQLSNQSE